MTIPTGVLGRIRDGSDAGRFVEVIEDRDPACFRVFSYSGAQRSAEILDGLFVSSESVEEYFASAGWDVEWLPEA